MIFQKQEILLRIEHEDLSLYLKGVPFDRKYESLTQYKAHLSFENEKMDLNIDGNTELVEVYDVNTTSLQSIKNGPFPPIFFENGNYQIVIVPKTSDIIRFYHEHPGLRNAVTPVDKQKNSILLGQLEFINEVGYSTFQILKNGAVLLEVTLEIFPSKLSYKDDYMKLLNEVNNEIYNLSFAFIKKTYLTGTSITSSNPTASEFYRLIEYFFPMFIYAIKQIENQPHHQLQKDYELVQAHRIKKFDHKSLNNLRKNPHWFDSMDQGLSVNNKSWIPRKGLNVKKTISFDNLENRFVKWMILRLLSKLKDLVERLQQKSNYKQDKIQNNKEVIDKIHHRMNQLKMILRKPFWNKIGKLDRSVINLVIQMKVGYRDVYKIYLILMNGISLQGHILKISLKDVALLYEYWTYLKIGQILRKHLILVNQDVVKHKMGSLFVKLDESSSSKQIFMHPQTKEKVILSYQYREYKDLPTVRQKPDILLEIEKKGVKYTYNYIFDAKYRINFESNNEQTYLLPGPMVEDINTMHRYRDALVIRNNGPYERHAFGAYVLFPWHDEENYENHQFYKSIDRVNIGGLPFLPNSAKLVERLLERLILSNPEELQEEGILPRGTISYWESIREEKVLVVSVNDPSWYLSIKQHKVVDLNFNVLKKGWEKVKYISLYITQNVAKKLGINNGIQFYGEIENIEILTNGNVHVRFYIKLWDTLPEIIRPVGYGIQNNIITNMILLKQAKELPELFMKFGEEIKLWRMLRRLSSKITTNLDSKLLDKANKIQAYQIGFYSVDLDNDNDEIQVSHYDEILATIPLNKLHTEPSYVFKKLRDIIFSL